MAFPRLIHFIWYQGLESAPNELRDIPRAWEKMNPGWKVMFWDGASLSRFIRSYYAGYFPSWNAHTSIIKKCDFARILLIFHFGGVYADMDLTPFRSLDDFLAANEVRHRLTFSTGRLPEPDTVERVDFTKRDIILTREYSQASDVGWPVANGIILSKPHLEFWLEFLNSRLNDAQAAVLNYVGPWALTRFIKSKTINLSGKCTVLPPYYFLWESYHFTQERPAWVVAEHGAKNFWGDHTKQDWWNVR